METEFAWRGINFFLAFFALSCLVNSWWLNRGRWNHKTFDAWFVLAGWTFAAMLGAVENILQENPAGSRTLLVTLLLLLTIRNYFRKEPVAIEPRRKRGD